MISVLSSLPRSSTVWLVPLLEQVLRPWRQLGVLRDDAESLHEVVEQLLGLDIVLALSNQALVEQRLELLELCNGRGLAAAHGRRRRGRRGRGRRRSRIDGLGRRGWRCRRGGRGGRRGRRM